MSTLYSMQVLLAVGEAVAASTLLMAIAWLGATQKTASGRHLVWCAGFGALLALPVLAAFAPSLIHLTVAAPVPAAAPPMDVAMAMTAPDTGFTLNPAMLAEAAFALWLAGVVLIFARAAFAAFALHRLRIRSLPHRFGHLAIDGPRCDLRLAAVDDSRGPVTWGLLRPVILLPNEAVTWSDERLDAVLRHELAHVARRDCLTQMLSLIACALYWPNPLVWFGARCMRREAEIAADDAVIVSGVRPSAYASQLLQIAQQFSGQKVLRLPLAMAAPTALEARVRQVLARGQQRGGVTLGDIGKVTGAAIVATFVLAMARPSLAETAPLAPPPAVVPEPPRPMMAAAPVQPVEPVAPPAAVEPPVAPAPQHTYTYIIDDPKTGVVHVYRHHPLSAQERAKVEAAIAAAHAAVENVRPQIAAAVRAAADARANVASLKMQQSQIAAVVAESTRNAMAQAHQAVEAARQSVLSQRMVQRQVLADTRAAMAQVGNIARVKAEVQRSLDRAQARIAAEAARMDERARVEDDSDSDTDTEE